ncbi:acetyltransferase [Serratia fonticola]|uniref:acetyltransferase n=1 Tax=Serratia fonticola TaxID=47917 RepID=UPI0016483D3C|nr:acetyltransferase [Serratia fonticola]MBC3229576.1 acetyltransferase [Serratia fonticola]
MTNNRVAIIGAGGHASAIIDILSVLNVDITLIVSPDEVINRDVFNGIKILKSDEELLRFRNEVDSLVNGVGFVINSKARTDVHNEFIKHGFEFLTVVSPHAYVSCHSVIGNGVQVMHGAIINCGVKIGDNSIINTGAIIEHDSLVGSHTHIAPGAIVCGGVSVGSNSYIGAGAIVINSIKIGDNVIIGAGAIVTKDVITNGIVYPARGMSKGLGEKND